jgi:hypothetical protein
VRRGGVVLAAAAAAALTIAGGCGTAQPGGMSGPTMNGRINQPLPSETVVSLEILDREPVSNRTMVKHILISWKDLAAAFGGNIDPRAAERSKNDAEDMVRKLRAELEAGAEFETLMRDSSEDKGSAQNGNAYAVRPDANLVLEFRQLGLRLEIGEIGVVETQFGFHIMKRVE